MKKIKQVMVAMIGFSIISFGLSFAQSTSISVGLKSQERIGFWSTPGGKDYITYGQLINTELNSLSGDLFVYRGDKIVKRIPVTFSLKVNNSHVVNGERTRGIDIIGKTSSGKSFIGRVDVSKEGKLTTSIKPNFDPMVEGYKYLGDYSVEQLLESLKDEDPSVRVESAIKLGEINDLRAVDPLITALKDDDFSVRVSAATALGKIKDSRAVEPLLMALKDKYASVRSSVADALKKITGQNFGEYLEEWEIWWKKSHNISIPESKSNKVSQSCEAECMELFKNGQLKKDISIEECAKMLCK